MFVTVPLITRTSPPALGCTRVGMALIFAVTVASDAGVAVGVTVGLGVGEGVGVEVGVDFGVLVDAYQAIEVSKIAKTIRDITVNFSID